MRRVLAAGILLIRFVWQVVVSGTSTAAIVLRPGRLPADGLIRFDYAPMSPAGAALLGCLVTLTPGTTVIDIDLERHEMLLHLLDKSQAEAAVSTIRREFEAYVALLFALPEETK
jgi:multisubunit Na+/H+ antiporter MnhE subunit